MYLINTDLGNTISRVRTYLVIPIEQFKSSYILLNPGPSRIYSILCHSSLHSIFTVILHLYIPHHRIWCRYYALQIASHVISVLAWLFHSSTAPTLFTTRASWRPNRQAKHMNSKMSMRCTRRLLSISPPLVTRCVDKSLATSKLHQVPPNSPLFQPWPIVERFLTGLAPGAVGLDVGCGNGKNLMVNRDVFIIASDRYVCVWDELLNFLDFGIFYRQLYFLGIPFHPFVSL